MKLCDFRSYLLAGVATGTLCGVTLTGMPGEAAAQSICNTDTSTTFSCADAALAPTAIATGTMSANSTLTSGPGNALNVSNDGSLEISLAGQLIAPASDQFGTFAVYVTAGGTLTYSNIGTTSGSTTGWHFNTYLQGVEAVIANTGTVAADGYRVTGVISEALNGDTTLTGGITTVSGVWSRGLWSDAFGGQNITNSGNVTATGYLSRGIIARAMDTKDGCLDDTGDLTTTVNVTGDVSADYVGVLTLTCGRSTVNVEPDHTVSVSGTEGMAILNMATGSADTNIGGDVLAASVADVALDVRAGASATSISGMGLLSGTFDGDEGADTITMSPGAVWISAGTSDFRGGADLLINSGTVNATAATFANLESFTNNGTLSLSGGSFALTGSTQFINNGTIDVAVGNTVVTSDAPFVNNGAINMQNGQAGDVLTIANDYIAGATASLFIDVSESDSDLFVVNGNSSGTTQIFVNAPELISSNRTLIGTLDAPLDQASAGGVVSTPAFKVALGNQAATRLIDYQLEQADGSLFLLALPNATAFQPMVVGRLGRDFWYQSADLHSSYVASHRNDTKAPRRKRVNVWGEAYTSRNVDGDRSSQTAFGSEVETDNRLSTTRTGIQAGIVIPLRNSIVAGLTGGYGRANADFRHLDGEIVAKGWNVGAYVGLGRETGPYGGLLVKYDRSNLKLKNAAFDSAGGRPDQSSLGAEAQTGYRWNSHTKTFELGASLAYVETSIDDFSAEGIDYDYDSTSSFRGSLDARIVFRGSKVEPFVNARLFHEFDGDSRLNLSSGSEADQIVAEGNKTWLRLEAGIGRKGSSGPVVSSWLDLGDAQALGVRAGWKF